MAWGRAPPTATTGARRQCLPTETRAVTTALARASAPVTRKAPASRTSAHLQRKCCIRSRRHVHARTAERTEGSATVAPRFLLLRRCKRLSSHSRLLLCPYTVGAASTATTAPGMGGTALRPVGRSLLTRRPRWRTTGYRVVSARRRAGPLGGSNDDTGRFGGEEEGWGGKGKEEIMPRSRQSSEHGSGSCGEGEDRQIQGYKKMSLSSYSSPICRTAPMLRRCLSSCRASPSATSSFAWRATASWSRAISDPRLPAQRFALCCKIRRGIVVTEGVWKGGGWKFVTSCDLGSFLYCHTPYDCALGHGRTLSLASSKKARRAISAGRCR